MEDYLAAKLKLDGLLAARWGPDRERRRSGLARRCPGVGAGSTSALAARRRSGPRNCSSGTRAARFGCARPRGQRRGAPAAARRVQRGQRAGRSRRRLAAGLSVDVDCRPARRRRRRCPGRMERIADRARGRAPRLRAHARRAGTGARGAPPAHAGPADRGLRLRRRSGPRQATGDGPNRRDAGRLGDRHLRQSAHRGPGPDHRRGGAGHGRSAHDRHRRPASGHRRGAPPRGAATRCCSRGRATRPTR